MKAPFIYLEHILSRSHAPAWECLTRRASGANPDYQFHFKLVHGR
jgi:hypothetical protein